MEKRMLKGFALLTMVAGSVSAAAEDTKTWGQTFKAIPSASLDYTKSAGSAVANHRGKVSTVAALISVGLDQLVLNKFNDAKKDAKAKTVSTAKKVGLVNPFTAKRNTKLAKASGIVAALLSTTSTGIVLGEKVVYDKLVFPRTEKGKAATIINRTIKNFVARKKLNAAAKYAVQVLPTLKRVQ